MRMHRGYDYVVCASDVTAGHFCEAFGTDRSKVVKYGLPRIDYIKSVSAGDRQSDMLAKILSRYPQLRGDKKTVLYAPTFRRGKTVDTKSITDAFDPAKYNIVIKLHPLYRGTAAADTGAGENVIFDDDFTSFDWLAAADIIISDYSSLVVESTLADRPLYIYAYDLEDYEADTGVNIDFGSEAIAPYVFRDAEALAKSVDSGGYDMEALRAFRDRYIDIDTSNCTATLADFIEAL